MTDDAAKLDREKKKLLVTDAELIRRLGVPEKVARPAIRALDSDPRSGFPRKQKLWGDRRYWPAVLAFLDRTGGLIIGASRTVEERHDGSPAHR